MTKRKEVITLTAIKNENRNNIYNAIRINQCISGPSLIYELKLSRPTVTQNLSELLEEGLIFDNGSFGNKGCFLTARSYSADMSGRTSRII